MVDETEQEIVDETPGYANAERFSPHTMGDPQVEYGVVDLDNHYPAESKTWQPEYPMDAPKERHLVVPFEVVSRGFTRMKTAKKAAEAKNGELNYQRYKAVAISDTRGV